MLDKKYEDFNDSIVANIYGKSVSCQKTPIERMVQLVASVQSPQKYCIAGYQVELEWKDTGKTIQDCVECVLMQNE